MGKSSLSNITPPQKTLKSRAIRGSIWTIGGYGTGQILRLLGNLILTRLLFPEAFGLMTLVNVFMQGMQMFSDVGVNRIVVQSKRGDDPDFQNTVWTIQIIRGVIISIGMCLIAWPATWLYSQNSPQANQLLFLIPICGLVPIIGGFNATAVYTAERHVAIGRITVLQLISQGTGIVTMIGWALIDASIWALVSGWFATAIVQLIGTHTLLPGIKNRLHWDPIYVQEIIHFGKWIFSSTATTFFARQADRLLLGYLISMNVLGVYSIALMLTSLPLTVSMKLIDSIFFPVLSEKARRDSEQLPQVMRRVRRSILPVAILTILGVVLLAPTFFSLLYDSRYHHAGWMAQAVSISVWINILQFSSDRGLLALGYSKPLAISNATNFIVTVVACLTGFYLFNLPGLIIGYAIGNLAGLVVIHISMVQIGISIFQQDLQYSAVLGLLALSGVAAQSLFPFFYTTSWMTS